jgi:hypothetical protein
LASPKREDHFLICVAGGSLFTCSKEQATSGLLLPERLRDREGYHPWCLQFKDVVPRPLRKSVLGCKSLPEAFQRFTYITKGAEKVFTNVPVQVL